jgi:hypothetical protein
MQFPQITCEPEEKGQILDTKTRILTENFFHRPPPPGSDDSDSKSSSTPSPGHDPENGDDNVNQGPDQSARNDGDAYRYEDDVSGYDVISNYMNEGGLQNMNGNENQGVDEDMDGIYMIYLTVGTKNSLRTSPPSMTLGESGWRTTLMTERMKIWVARRMGVSMRATTKIQNLEVDEEEAGL